MRKVAVDEVAAVVAENGDLIDMPGRTFAAAGETGEKWGSIKPSEIRRSASAATRSMMHGAPEGSTPTCTLLSGLRQSWTTISPDP